MLIAPTKNSNWNGNQYTFSRYRIRLNKEGTSTKHVPINKPETNSPNGGTQW